MARLCVFCGSSSGGRPVFVEQARAFGTALAGLGLELVFGGGRVGLMGVLADAVLEAGGTVLGVIPRALVEKELAHQGATHLHVVATMHERKALMADRADYFAALPGGFGTADELFEILTWAQLGLHTKPIGLLNVAGYFDPLLAWIDRTIQEGFLKLDNRRFLRVSDNPRELLDRLIREPAHPSAAKWIDVRDR
jgi:uncharacterized protein (TIGR00730 family)